MEFKFERARIDKIPREEIVKELRRVAELFNYRRFGWREYDKVATLCKSATVKKTFGSWNKALNSIGIELREVDRNIYHDKELFNEMERIWKRLGHRPSKTEWETSQPKIHYGTYKGRFGGWTNACLQFIEYKMGKNVLLEYEAKESYEEALLTDKLERQKNKRDIPLRLRLAILKRDKFRCVLCGRSPATHAGVSLHIDHIVPYSKEGTSTIDNLQTLCSECNLGKSDQLEY